MAVYMLFMLFFGAFVGVAINVFVLRSDGCR